MKIVNEIENLILKKDTIVMVGKFDGMHLGHKRLLELLIKKSKEKDLCTVVILLFFEKECKEHVPQQKAKQLMTKREKELYFQKYGINILVEQHVDNSFMKVSHEDFLKKILIKNLKAKAIVISENSKFGYKAIGNASYLKENEKLGYKTYVCETEKYNSKVISSSMIKEELKTGHIKEANDMLGRNYSFRSIVVHGNGIGKENGIPTINIDIDDDKVLPPFGVYSGYAIIGDGNLREKNKILGIINIGTRPTISKENKPNLEMHLLNFNKELYNKEVEVFLNEYIRAEKQFENIEELFAQVKKDIQFVVEKENLKKNYR